jgi:hypothetical protein
MIVWIVGVFSSLLSVYLGTRFLGIGPLAVLTMILVANVSGFFAVLAVLGLEQYEWVRRRVIFRGAMAWILFWTLSLGPMYALLPLLRGFRPSLILLLPLIGSCGFMIPLFGMVQDRIVSRRQQRQGQRRTIPLFARALSGAISFNQHPLKEPLE